MKDPLWDVPAPSITARKPIEPTTRPRTFRANSATASMCSTWKGRKKPKRLWLVRDMIPMFNVALFTGEGAIGKSTLMLRLCGQVAAQKDDWISWEIAWEPDEKGHDEIKRGAIYYGAEDDEDELHRRVDDVLQATGRDYDDFAHRFHVFERTGRDAVLAVANRQGIVVPTTLYRDLLARVIERKPKLIALDTSADVFAGNENDRAQVRQFIGLLRALAIAGSSAVVLAAHPSLTGINNESGLSGSTAWHNSVRAQLNLTADDPKDKAGLRVLSARKNNYGPIAALVRLLWVAGVYKPVGTPSTLDKLAADQKVEQMFLDLLDRHERVGDNVSPKSTANNYAPTVFAKTREAKAARIDKDAFVAALDRLMEAGKVDLKAYGSPSDETKRLARRRLL